MTGDDVRSAAWSIELLPEVDTVFEFTDGFDTRRLLLCKCASGSGVQFSASSILQYYSRI